MPYGTDADYRKNRRKKGYRKTTVNICVQHGEVYIKI